MVVIFFREEWKMEAFFQKVSNGWATKTAIWLNDDFFLLIFLILRKRGNSSRLCSFNKLLKLISFG